MKNKPLIDNYEQILEQSGYQYTSISGIFYVYRMLPMYMGSFSAEDWKYWNVVNPFSIKNKQLHLVRYK